MADAQSTSDTLNYTRRFKMANESIELKSRAIVHIAGDFFDTETTIDLVEDERLPSSTLCGQAMRPMPRKSTTVHYDELAGRQYTFFVLHVSANSLQAAVTWPSVLANYDA